MASPTTDRRQGLAGNTAFKAPVDTVATSNVALSGEQTIASVTTNNSRVLLAGQTDARQNGIWDTSTAAWSRSVDANGNYDLTSGSIVGVASGSGFANTIWILNAANPITIGTTAMSWLPSPTVDFTAYLANLPLNLLSLMSSAQRTDVLAYTYTQDVTSVIQGAIATAQATGRSVYAPAGGYKHTGLTITDDISIVGDGGVRSIFKLYSASVVANILVALPNNSSFIGGRIQGIGLICNGGAATGDGLVITTTATNSAVSQSSFRDLYIQNVRDGIRLDGVIYKCAFENITVTGGVSRYGFYTDSALEVLYNVYSNMEVTNCANGAWGYWIKSGASTVRDVTSDAPQYYAGAGLKLINYTIETIHAAAPPTYGGNAVGVVLNQIASAEQGFFTNVPNAKINYLIDYTGSACNIDGVRVADAGAGNQPNRSFLFRVSNFATIANVKYDRAITDKLEAHTSDAIMNGFTFSVCQDITTRSMLYQLGAWTPSFATGWTTPPTVVSARYQLLGRMVIATIYGQNGVCTAGAKIGGLPVASDATAGIAVAGGSSDSADRLAGSILPGTTEIANIPATTLTGDFWQMSATYFT